MIDERQSPRTRTRLDAENFPRATSGRASSGIGACLDAEGGTSPPHTPLGGSPDRPTVQPNIIRSEPGTTPLLKRSPGLFGRQSRKSRDPLCSSPITIRARFSYGLVSGYPTVRHEVTTTRESTLPSPSQCRTRRYPPGPHARELQLTQFLGCQGPQVLVLRPEIPAGPGPHPRPQALPHEECAHRPRPLLRRRRSLYGCLHLVTDRTMTNSRDQIGGR